MVKIHLSNQDLLTCPKIDIFFLFLDENISCGYSLEAPQDLSSPLLKFLPQG